MAIAITLRYHRDISTLKCNSIFSVGLWSPRIVIDLFGILLDVYCHMILIFKWIMQLLGICRHAFEEKIYIGIFQIDAEKMFQIEFNHIYWLILWAIVHASNQDRAQPNTVQSAIEIKLKEKIAYSSSIVQIHSPSSAAYCCCSFPFQCRCCKAIA